MTCSMPTQAKNQCTPRVTYPSEQTAGNSGRWSRCPTCEHPVGLKPANHHYLGTPSIFCIDPGLDLIVYPKTATDTDVITR